MKSSNALGLILLFVLTTLAGAGLSLIYLSLVPELAGVWLYLGILPAIAFGAVLGAVVSLLVRFLRITNPGATFGIVLLACVCFTYAKWGTFLERDSRRAWNSGNVYDYLELLGDFDADEPPPEREQLLEKLEKMNSMTAYEYIDSEYGFEDYQFYSGVLFTREEIEEMREKTYFDYHAAYSRYGSTPETAVDGIMNSPDYGYMMIAARIATLETRELVVPAQHFLLNPADFADMVLRINSEGRWIHSDELVTGAAYAAVWGVEFLLICLPVLVMASRRAGLNRYADYGGGRKRKSEPRPHPEDSYPVPDPFAADGADDYVTPRGKPVVPAKETTARVPAPGGTPYSNINRGFEYGEGFHKEGTASMESVGGNYRRSGSSDESGGGYDGYDDTGY